MRKYFLLDERNLARQPLFRLSIGIPLIAFIILGINVWWDYDFALNQKAYNNFMEVSKLPLLCLSLCVPLVAIVAHMHRTVQTEKQIRHTQEQIENTQRQIALLEEKNRPDSYYAHVKSITEAITSIPGFKVSRDGSNIKQEVSIKYPHPLYKKIFKKSNVIEGYNPEINMEFFDTIRNKYDRINKILISAETLAAPESRLQSANLLNLTILLLCNELSLNYNNEERSFTISVYESRTSYKTSFSSEEEIKEMIKGIKGVIFNLYSFLDIDYEFLFPTEDSGDYINAYIYGHTQLYKDFYPVSKHLPLRVSFGGIVAADDTNSH